MKTCKCALYESMTGLPSWWGAVFFLIWRAWSLSTFAYQGFQRKGERNTRICEDCTCRWERERELWFVFSKERDDVCQSNPSAPTMPSCDVLSNQWTRHPNPPLNSPWLFHGLCFPTERNTFEMTATVQRFIVLGWNMQSRACNNKTCERYRYEQSKCDPYLISTIDPQPIHCLFTWISPCKLSDAEERRSEVHARWQSKGFGSLRYDTVNPRWHTHSYIYRTGLGLGLGLGLG